MVQFIFISAARKLYAPNSIYPKIFGFQTIESPKICNTHFGRSVCMKCSLVRPRLYPLALTLPLNGLQMHITISISSTNAFAFHRSLHSIELIQYTYVQRRWNRNTCNFHNCENLIRSLFRGKNGVSRKHVDQSHKRKNQNNDQQWCVAGERACMHKLNFINCDHILISLI